jgi:glycosyltransferase involved in cell wall biosynthesis
MEVAPGRRPLRVALTVHGAPLASMGGVGLYVESLARALVEAGHAVAVIAPEPGPLPPGVEGFCPPRRAGGGLHQTWSDPLRQGALRAFFRRWRPDLLHVHHTDGLGFDPLRVAAELGLRRVITLHDYALPCARGQLLDADLKPCAGPSPAACARCLAPRLRAPPLAPTFASRLPAPLRAWGMRGLAAHAEVDARDEALLAERGALLAQSLDGATLLSPSVHLGRRVEALGLGAPRPCPLPLLGPVRPRPAIRPAGPIRLVFVGSLHPAKGVDLLADAVAALPPGQATLDLIGPDCGVEGQPDWSARLRRRLAGCAALRWRGALSPAAVREALGDHDALALPSRWAENSPLVVREATAAGLHTLLSVDGGGVELDPEATIVRNGDAADLADGLRRLMGVALQPRSPRAWTTPQHHAEWLVDAVYRR